MHVRKKLFLIMGVTLLVMAMGANAFAALSSSLSTLPTNANQSQTFDLKIFITSTASEKFSGFDSTVTFPQAKVQITNVVLATGINQTTTTANANTSGSINFAYLDLNLPPTGLDPATAGNPAVTITFTVGAAATGTIDIGNASATAWKVSDLADPPVDVTGSYPIQTVTIGGASTDPTITLPLNPATGPIAGGTTVTITGNNFVSGSTAVTFGGTAATVGTVTSTSISCTTPAHAAGAVDVVVTVTGKTPATAAGAFTYTDTTNPTITLPLNPATGPIAGGTIVTITGTNFVSGSTAVTFGGTAATLGTVTSTSISCTTPAHAVGAVDVVVTVTGKTPATAAGAFTYTSATDPTITLPLNPATGPIAGGTTVTITGTNFVSGSTAVTFGGTAATVGTVTSTSISCTTPAHAAGAVDVVVTVTGKTPATAAGAFTYTNTNPTITLPLNPATGTTAGGTTVTITGTNFVSGSTAVTFGGTAATVGTVTATSITCTTPAHAVGAVDVVVTVTGKTPATAAGAFTYTTPPPTASNTVLTTTAGVAKSSKLSATGGTGTLTYSKGTTDSVNGISTVNADGSYGYSPNAGFSGTDKFTFIATDASNVPSNEATVTITVLPAANAAAFSTTKNTFITGTLTALGKGPFTYTVNQPANGAVAANTAYPNFKYTPNNNYVSAGTPPVPDTFTFSVKDANGLSSASATVSVTVYASNTAPVANNLTLTTRPVQAVNGVLPATDTEGNPLTYTIVTQPANGTLVPNTAYPNFTYTPNTGFGTSAAATDTFTYKVNDGTTDSAANGTVTITVNPMTTNTPPVANNGAYTGTVGQPISGKLNGTDVDGDLLSYIIVTEPACGDVQLSNGNSPDAGVPANFTYLPRLDKAGCPITNTAIVNTDSFTYKVKERANSPTFPESATTGTITLTINPVCTPAIAEAKLTSVPAAVPPGTGTITLATPQSVTFTDTSGGASRVWTVVNTATGSTVETSTVTPFTYSFATTGTYTVYLTAADAAGCATPQPATVTVVVGGGTTPCTVTITSNPAATGGIVTVPTASLPATVTFTGSTAGTWSMTGPSGAITPTGGTTGASTSHDFAAGSDGTYTVKLTATPAGCTTPSTATLTVYVGMRITSVQLNPANAAQLLINGTGFAAAATSAVCGSEVWYNTANSTTGATKLSPITVTAGTQITFTKPSAGTYYFFVKNTCTTPAAWSNAFPFSVPSDYVPDSTTPVTPTVTAGFTVNGKTDQVTGCAPLEVQFTNASTAGYLTCSWWFGDGNDTTKDPDSMECNPKHSYAKAGLYSVTLQIFGFNGSGTTTLKDFVKVDSCCVTTASFTTNPATGTAPLAVSFDASASKGDNFAWDFGDTQTGTGKTATHTYAAAGTYTVTLTVTDANGKCTQTSTATVTVAAAVNCDIVAASFAANPMSGNKPLAVHFDASASKNAATYAWDYGDGATGSGITSDHTFTTAKDYTVTLTVKDATGKCTKTATQTIKVAQGACTTAASFTAEPMSGTAPLNVLFNAAGSSADVKTYAWDYGDGQTDTGVSPAKHSFTKAGSYTVTLMVTGDCTASAKKTIEVKASDRPNQPVLLTPANNSTRVSLTPTLTVQSNYSSPVNAPHAKTRWQIALDKDFNNLVYDITNSQNLTSIWVPDFILKPNTVYYWRVQFIDNRNVSSDWSEIFTFTTVETNAEDVNNNGIPDTQEVASTDASSLCAKSPKNGVTVCIKSNGAKPTGLKWISASTLPAGPTGITFPADLFTFKSAAAKAGDKITVTMMFSDALPANAVWYKYNQNNQWADYSNTVTVVDGKTATLTLTDGGSGDSDGTPNSLIVDPIGFGTGTTTACLDCGDDGGGGCFISAVSGGTSGAAGMAIFSLISMAGIYFSRRSK